MCLYVTNAYEQPVPELLHPRPAHGDARFFSFDYNAGTDYATASNSLPNNHYAAEPYLDHAYPQLDANATANASALRPATSPFFHPSEAIVGVGRDGTFLRVDSARVLPTWSVDERRLGVAVCVEGWWPLYITEVPPSVEQRTYDRRNIPTMLTLLPTVSCEPLSGAGRSGKPQRHRCRHAALALLHACGGGLYAAPPDRRAHRRPAMPGRHRGAVGLGAPSCMASAPVARGGRWRQLLGRAHLWSAGGSACVHGAAACRAGGRWNHRYHTTSN